MSTNPFHKAEKRKARLRLAILAPPKAGKTWTALALAHAIKDEADNVAVIDTERGSAELYADRFDFDVAPMFPPYSPSAYVRLIQIADGIVGPNGVIVIDSLSHAWEGDGGVQSIVDANAKGGNAWAGWAKGTPEYRKLIDAIYGCQAHVIATMRTKIEWAEGLNERGKKTYVRVGTAPVMRPGIEYEFTVVAEIDKDTHSIDVTHSRAGTALKPVYPGGPHGSVDNAENLGEDLVAWLNSGKAPAPAWTAEDFVAECAKRGWDRDQAKAIWRSESITEEMLRQDSEEVARRLDVFQAKVRAATGAPAPAAEPEPEPPAAEPVATTAASEEVGDDGLRKWERDALTTFRNVGDPACLDEVYARGSDAAREKADALVGDRDDEAPQG